MLRQVINPVCWLLLPAVLGVWGCQDQGNANATPSVGQGEMPTSPSSIAKTVNQPAQVQLRPTPPPATLAQSAATPSANSSITSSDQAIALLQATIERDNLYSGRLSIACLSFSLEDATTTTFDLAIYERHGGNCGGDPQVSPLVDRFRVNTDGTLLWYDVVSDQYLPYSEVRERIGQS